MIRIPPLFIQPFVENAVKHGMKDMDRGCRIALRFTDLGKMLRVEIEDNGKGISHNPDRTTNHVSRSGEIVSKRLSLLSKKHKKILH